MAQITKESRESQLRGELEELRTRPGLPFQQLLDVQKIQAALDACECSFRVRVFDPFQTLWAFLSQVYAGETSSCQDAVSRLQADRAVKKLPPISSDTSSYCEARARLPQQVVEQLTREVGQELQAQAPHEWRWKGRPVKIVDGSTATMADTPDNQQEFPQSRNQKPGLGFPILRFVLVISLAVGTVLECALGPCRGKKTGEQSLFRQIQAVIQEDDILLGDCLFDAYVDIAKLAQRKADVVFGMKQSRRCDFRKGKRLGPDDHIVEWQRPAFDASRFESREEWESLPPTLPMREIRTFIRRKGYRTRKVVIVTTLLDATKYSAEEIMELFAQRWHCELDLRSLKRSLGLHHLRCKTPDMVKKELWMYLLGYNLIRVRMAQAAARHGVQPRRLSFTAARNHIHNFGPLLSVVSPAEFKPLEAALLKAIAGNTLLSRPGRKEPRAVKKRPKKYPALTQTRTKARKGLMA